MATVFAVAAATGEQEATFKVSGAATTDFDGDPDCFVIRDDAEPAQKYYTNSKDVYQDALAAKKGDAALAVVWVERKSGKNTVRWIKS